MPKISAQITMFSDYRPKEFLKSVASSFGCSVTIDDQRDKGIADANIVCDWNQETGTCFRCKGK